MEEKIFDGRSNWTADDQIEQMLEAHFEKYNISKREIWRNFQIYTRRVFLKKFLAHYEFFLKVIDLPGDIVELGVYRGASLMSWANFLELRNMGDRHRKVIGFDNFTGFGQLHEKDGVAQPGQGKVEQGFNSSIFEEALQDAINIFDADRFIPYKPRIELVKGDIEQTIPQYLHDHPGTRISLLHFDADMYLPTKIGLEYLYPLVVHGGVILFDEYGIPPWEGESKAVDEYFSDKNIIVHRLNWTPNPGGFIIKE